MKLNHHPFLYIFSFFILLIYPSIMGNSISQSKTVKVIPTISPKIDSLVKLINKESEVVLKQKDTLKHQYKLLYEKKQY